MTEHIIKYIKGKGEVNPGELFLPDFNSKVDIMRDKYSAGEITLDQMIMFLNKY